MEVMAIEATKAVAGINASLPAQIDPNAVVAFQDAMETGAVTDIPFAQQVSSVWHAAEVRNQELLHRITALTDMARVNGISQGAMLALQYDVANLSFQQEIVTNIAKKASDGISTLVKNG